MARQQRAIRTRRIFLEAAAEVFDEHGYDAATIAAILERAGLTRGALYFHFTSKEELARGVLEEAVTSDGVTPQTFKLQEWVDIALLLAYRLPREPMLSASIRLSVDPRARSLFGTRWPDWITLGAELLTEAKERGELLPHVDPVATSRLLVGAWTGVQLVTESMADAPDLVTEISALFELILPNNAVPGVLARLDTSPHRAERIIEENRAAAAAS
ncbi:MULTISPECIES: ScbR family autoregulator-binding transcription factor [Streptomyces]|uniref:AcrR family transcriptional regulator n=1 Tax=Streptomyces clavifer TaxID=68188 RepID=A0ABS4V947_9ACTN|nr:MULTISPECIES: ScbR family autoregulator-binding transcription factor [Streptomyces]KQX77740.1 gamma-butyrolactone-binding protein [Streptomyces sp. Root1319]KQZ10357.1 gamma-butyrolactone-binding protein [Streptomyces sp. Root55]MBP2360449.1 AcrR family transcriptional regulator [Streptomyces clavifer]MDX2743603.1 ScbR family autoregulator-binding transcription factor [Streptomyces sp. NRRL_B-2557]MDX3065380.1 ScbR family autoregulator-binding transcription factor [Streptomyces sp. ND04-05B